MDTSENKGPSCGAQAVGQLLHGIKFGSHGLFDVVPNNWRR